MTMLDILGFKDIYPLLTQAAFPIKTAYKINKLVDYVEAELVFYNSELQNILEKYAEKEENGNYKLTEDLTGIKIQPDKITECEKEIEGLNSLEITTPPVSIDIEELSDLSLTIKDMAKLAPFLK